MRQKNLPQERNQQKHSDSRARHDIKKPITQSSELSSLTITIINLVEQTETHIIIRLFLWLFLLFFLLRSSRSSTGIRRCNRGRCNSKLTRILHSFSLKTVTKLLKTISGAINLIDNNKQYHCIPLSTPSLYLPEGRNTRLQRRQQEHSCMH